METESKDYKDHLENKYLWGRSFYLHHFFYPKIVSQFGNKSAILDLGCGLGEFLMFCKKQNRIAKGIDSNAFLVNSCIQKGLDAQVDNICNIENCNISDFQNIVIDNVLEHLTVDELHIFFENISKKMLVGSKICIIVPGKKGFHRDPTHKTFIDKTFLTEFIEKYSLSISQKYYHPVNIGILGQYVYLNMSVFYVVKI